MGGLSRIARERLTRIGGGGADGPYVRMRSQLQAKSVTANDRTKADKGGTRRPPLELRNILTHQGDPDKERRVFDCSTVEDVYKRQLYTVPTFLLYYYNLIFPLYLYLH